MCVCLFKSFRKIPSNATRKIPPIPMCVDHVVILYPLRCNRLQRQLDFFFFFPLSESRSCCPSDIYIYTKNPRVAIRLGTAILISTPHRTTTSVLRVLLKRCTSSPTVTPSSSSSLSSQIL